MTKDCFPAYNRDAWLQKFKRFNPAISSSAAVERLFAVGFDILRLKRSSMTKENFEKFVLLRENEKCLKKSIFLHDQRIISECELVELFLFWCLFIFIAVYFYHYFLFQCLIAFFQQ